MLNPAAKYENIHMSSISERLEDDFSFELSVNNSTEGGELKDYLKDFDRIMHNKINKGIKQAMIIVLQKLDGLIHHKFSQINQQSANTRSFVEERMETIEQRVQKRFLELQKNFLDFEFKIHHMIETKNDSFMQGL